MEIDLSKVVILVLAVMPGYFALRAIKSIAPLGRQRKGTTEELAEFIGYSVFSHILLLSIAISARSLAGNLLTGYSPLSLRALMLQPTSRVVEQINSLPTAITMAYLPLSFAVGWGLGFLRGLIACWKPLDSLGKGLSKLEKGAQLPVIWWKRLPLLTLGWLLLPLLRLWSRWVGRFFINETPIIYDVMFPEVSNGRPNLVFVEVELKQAQGIYTGQVINFSLLRDEEPHKLLYLADVAFRPSWEKDYDRLPDGYMFIDLSEAVTVNVIQTERPD
jgi:hypothetical protein